MSSSFANVEFRTTDAPSPLYCHLEFLEQIDGFRSTSVGSRTSNLLRLLAIAPQIVFFKSTQGANRGWRRSALGGGSGFHYYAWWAPRRASVLRHTGGFDKAPTGSIFIRAIRHHDDHSPLSAADFEEDYFPITVSDLRAESYVPSPFSLQQLSFAQDTAVVRLLKGHPGSGKTTALLHATDNGTRSAALYLTYSNQLATLASDYFRRFAPAEKHFYTTTFSLFLHDLIGEKVHVPSRPGRDSFVEAVDTLPPQRRGPWADYPQSLFNEIHAHLIGSALPETVGRFHKAKGFHLHPDDYRAKRERVLGRDAVNKVLEIVRTLDNQNANFLPQCFRELSLARRVAQKLSSKDAADMVDRFKTIDCLAVDEVQDLTPLEAYVVARVARLVGERQDSLTISHLDRNAMTMLFAGDESQTVRPTEFEWTWLNEILHSQVSPGRDFPLTTNLRSPKRIGRLLQSIATLYQRVGKADRPRGSIEAQIEDIGGDRLIYCRASLQDDVGQLLRAFSVRARTAIIRLSESQPAYVPQDVQTLTAQDVKGLDFNSICLLDPGKHLQTLFDATDNSKQSASVGSVELRLAIDKLRVAASRPTERIYFLDVTPSDGASRRSFDLLQNADLEEPLTLTSVSELLHMLENDILDAEERVQLYLRDALDLLGRKPRMAWQRVEECISLLDADGGGQVEDSDLRQTAYSAAARVAFCLALRGVPLNKDDVNLWESCFRFATLAESEALSEVVALTKELHKAPEALRGQIIYSLIGATNKLSADAKSWLFIELKANCSQWLAEFERLILNAEYTVKAVRLLPTAYDVFGITESLARTRTKRLEAARFLMSEKMLKAALEILRPPKRELQSLSFLELQINCYQQLGRFFASASLCLDAAKRSVSLLEARSWAQRAVELAAQGSSDRHLKLIAECRLELAMRSYLLALREAHPAERLEQLIRESAENSALAHRMPLSKQITALNLVMSAPNGHRADAIIAFLFEATSESKISWFKQELRKFVPEWTSELVAASGNLNLMKKALSVPTDAWKSHGMQSCPNTLIDGLETLTEKMIEQGEFEAAMAIIVAVDDHRGRQPRIAEHDEGFEESNDWGDN